MAECSRGRPSDVDLPPEMRPHFNPILETLYSQRDFLSLCRLWRLLASKRVPTLDTDEDLDWVDITRFTAFASAPIRWEHCPKAIRAETGQKESVNPFSIFLQEAVIHFANKAVQSKGMWISESEKNHLLEFISLGWGIEAKVVQLVRKVASGLWNKCEKWERDRAARALRRRAGPSQFHRSYSEREAVKLMETVVRFFIPAFTLPPSHPMDIRYWERRDRIDRRRGNWTFVQCLKCPRNDDLRCMWLVLLITWVEHHSKIPSKKNEVSPITEQHEATPA